MNKRLFEIYRRLLEIHIQSFTTGTQYHGDTEKAYELAFDVFHSTSEIKQAMGDQETTNCEDSGQEAYDLIEEMKSINEDMIKSNKESGFDNLLRGLSEKLVLLCGKFQQYTNKQEEEKESQEEEEPKQAKKIQIPTRRY